jgi:exopolysaccharide production protein ExoQ
MDQSGQGFQNFSVPLAEPAPVSFGLQALTSFLLTVQMMFLPNTGTLGVVAILGCLGLLAVTHMRAMFRRLVHSFPASIFWIVAMLSVLWSAHHRITAVYAVELMITTMIALVIGGIDSRRGVLPGIAAGLAFYVVASLVSGGSVAMGSHGDEAFSGLTGSKNYLAATAVFGLVALICAVGEALSDRAFRRAALLALAVPIVFVVMISSKSSGALVETIAIVGLIAFLAIVRKLPLEIRFAALLVLVTAIVALGTLYYLQRDAIDQFVLTTFQKDPTLTGRIYLWQRADDIIAQNPWLGKGYYAFWVQGDLDAEGLWQWAGITLRGGFNFHNTARETLVAFGWVGFAVFALATAYTLVARSIDCINQAEFYDIFWLGILVYNLIAMSWESALPQPFNMASILLIAAYRPLSPNRLWRVAGLQSPAQGDRIAERGLAGAVVHG